VTIEKWLLVNQELTAAAAAAAAVVVAVITDHLLHLVRQVEDVYTQHNAEAVSYLQ